MNIFKKLKLVFSIECIQTKFVSKGWHGFCFSKFSTHFSLYMTIWSKKNKQFIIIFIMCRFFESNCTWLTSNGWSRLFLSLVFLIVKNGFQNIITDVRTFFIILLIFKAKIPSSKLYKPSIRAVILNRDPVDTWKWCR